MSIITMAEVKMNLSAWTLGVRRLGCLAYDGIDACDEPHDTVEEHYTCREVGDVEDTSMCTTHAVWPKGLPKDRVLHQHPHVEFKCPRKRTSTVLAVRDAYVDGKHIPLTYIKMDAEDEGYGFAIPKFIFRQLPFYQG